MKKDKINVCHIHIDLKEDLIYSHDVLVGSFKDFKSKTMFNNRDLVMKYKLLAKYNFDEKGTVRYVVDWIGVVSEMIERKMI